METPVFSYYLHEKDGMYHVTIFRKTEKTATVGRVYHINRKKAIEMAVKDLEQNLKIATNLSKRK